MRAEPGLHHVLARHEQSAGFMADGYARVSEGVGVVCTITGPGVTNVATAVANAYADSVPTLRVGVAGPGHANPQHEQGGGKREDPVAEGLDA